MSILASSSSSRDSKLRVRWYFISLGILLAWLIAKLLLFRGFEYTSDIIIHTQKSQSYLWGLPVLYDEIHGPHPYHNNFIELLLGPLTYHFGSYGLILPTWLLFSFMIWELLGTAKRSYFLQRQQNLFAIFGVLLGPMGFWLWDDFVYGWHPEILAFPLAALVTSALIDGGRARLVVYTMLLVSVHEAGAIVAGGIFLMHSQFELSPSVRARERVIRGVLCILSWAFVFIVGLLLQRFWDSAGSLRLAKALSTLYSADLALVRDVGRMWLQLLLFLVSCGLVVPFHPRRAMISILVLFCCIPLVVTGTISSFAYGSTNLLQDMHNLLWQPRFVFIWSLVFSGMLLGINSSKEMKVTIIPRTVTFILVVLALVMWTAQYLLLLHSRDYDVWRRITQAASGPSIRDRYSIDEQRFLSCMSERVPAHAAVFSTPTLWTAFHRQRVTPFSQKNPFRTFPHVVLCDRLGREPLPSDCSVLLKESVLRSEYRQTDWEGFGVAYHERFAKIVRGCSKKARRPQ